MFSVHRQFYLNILIFETPAHRAHPVWLKQADKLSVRCNKYTENVF